MACRHSIFHNQFESKSPFLRACLTIIALALLVGQTYSWAAGIIGWESKPTPVYPSNSPFIEMSVHLPKVGPEAPKPVFDRLMLAVEQMQSKSFVPYVYGGQRVGEPKACLACAACVKAKHLPANSTDGRLSQCSACRRCGVDCSNFVNQIYERAGVNYPFADTSALRRASDEHLTLKYGFLDMGRDLHDARPGDLILQKDHVVLLLSVNEYLGSVDYIHASRGSKLTPAGGIELRRGFDYFRFQRQVVRILRHRDLVAPDGGTSALAANWWIDLRRLFAWNS